MSKLPRTNVLLELAQNHIRNERIALGLSQKEFSDFVGIKFSTYRTFEQDGKMSFENILNILTKLNKDIEFEQFLKGFEFNNSKLRAAKKKEHTNIVFQPIIPASQKQITLDKKIFGNDLFYSVENGHIYNISKFVSIMLSAWNDHRLMLLIKYFGEERLKPYILEQKDIGLLNHFNRHLAYIKKEG